MADLKISQLPELVELPDSIDEIAIVDASAGTTKKVSKFNLTGDKADKSTILSVTAPISGGGDLSTNRTIGLDVNSLTGETSPQPLDELLLWDVSTSAFKKITKTNLFSGITGSLSYQGLWNASTNTPTLSDGTGATNQYYVTNVAGSQDLGSGIISFDAGDWVLHNGSEWQKLENQSASEAINVEYDNTSSGMSATNVQEGLDELDTDIGTNTSNIGTNTADIANLQTGKLDSVVAGTNVTVDNTDPINPIISSAGGISENQAIAFAVAL